MLLPVSVLAVVSESEDVDGVGMLSEPVESRWCCGVAMGIDIAGEIWTIGVPTVRVMKSRGSSTTWVCSGTRWSSDFRCDIDRWSWGVWWEKVYGLRGWSWVSQAVIAGLSWRDSERRVAGTAPFWGKGMLPPRWDVDPLEFVRTIEGADRWESVLGLDGASIRSYRSLERVQVVRQRVPTEENCRTIEVAPLLDMLREALLRRWECCLWIGDRWCW